MDSRLIPSKHASSIGTATTFALAGVNGVIARSLVAPFSVAKIYGEVGVPGGKMGPFQAFRYILRDEGFKGFYRGNATACGRLFMYAGIQYSVATGLLKQFVNLTPNRYGEPQLLSLAGIYTAGAIGGAFGTIVTHPLDVVKTRLTINPTAPAKAWYRGAIHCFQEIAAKEGLATGIYRGFTFSVIGSSACSGALFVGWTIAGNLPWRRRSAPLIPLEWFVAPAAAVTGAYFVSHPFDVLRKKFMAQSAVLPHNGYVDCKFTGLLDCVFKTYKTNGLWGFWHGWLANSFKVVPQLTVFFVVYSGARMTIGQQALL